MLGEFGELSRQFWGRHLWAREYFVASSGNVTDEVLAQYIEAQREESSVGDEDFQIESFRRLSAGSS
jgi:putative transposase